MYYLREMISSVPGLPVPLLPFGPPTDTHASLAHSGQGDAKSGTFMGKDSSVPFLSFPPLAHRGRWWQEERALLGPCGPAQSQ